jgi:hypothetical protein
MTEDIPKAMTEDIPKDIWDKLKSLATTISLIAVPILVAYIGSTFERGAKEAETRQRTVQLAVSILQEKPKEGSLSSLRDWAIIVINAYSGIPLPDSAKKELRVSALPIYNPIQTATPPISSKYVSAYLDENTPPVPWEYGMLSFASLNGNTATIRFGNNIVTLTDGISYEDPDNHCSLTFTKLGHGSGILLRGACP